MAEPVESALDAPVSPVRVLTSKADEELSEFRVDGRPTGLGGGWLGPVAGDEASVPTDHRRGADDQEHLRETASVEHGGEHGEDRSVRLWELCSVDLALQYEDLVAQSEDLGVSPVTGGEHPSESREDQSGECGERVHGSATVSGRRQKPPEPWGGRVYGTHRVTWKIEAIVDSCRLTVTHDQLREGANDQLFGGWPMILSGLKTWLETGELLTTPGSLMYS